MIDLDRKPVWPVRLGAGSCIAVLIILASLSAFGADARANSCDDAISRFNGLLAQLKAANNSELMSHESRNAAECAQLTSLLNGQLAAVDRLQSDYQAAVAVCGRKLFCTLSFPLGSLCGDFSGVRNAFQNALTVTNNVCRAMPPPTREEANGKSTLPNHIACPDDVGPGMILAEGDNPNGFVGGCQGKPPAPVKLSDPRDNKADGDTLAKWLDQFFAGLDQLPPEPSLTPPPPTAVKAAPAQPPPLCPSDGSASPQAAADSYADSGRRVIADGKNLSCGDLHAAMAFYANGARIYDCLGENPQRDHANQWVNYLDGLLNKFETRGECSGPGTSPNKGRGQPPPKGSACPLGADDLKTILAQMSAVADSSGYGQDWLSVRGPAGEAGCAVPTIGDCRSAEAGHQFPSGCRTHPAAASAEVSGCGQTDSIRDKLCRSVNGQQQ
jgi:hypothetical protein